MKSTLSLSTVLLALGAGGAAALGIGALLLTRPFAAPRWEEALPHPDSIYDNERSHPGGASTIPVISPFHLHTEPMESLLLINFESDPDQIYLGFEPQTFNDDVHGQGMLVLGWRVDGQVDVYHDPELRLDPETYGIAGKGLHTMVERSFSDARFELGPAGAQVDLSFEDLEGREVRLSIRETDTRLRRPFSFLAPMGSAATDPPALPLVYVHDFYFVRKAGSEVRIEIDGRSHQGDPIPILLDGTRVHFVRYSPAPFIVTWNPNPEGQADVLAVDSSSESGIFTSEHRGVRYELASNGSFREIRRMSRSAGVHEVVVDFSPAFPDLLNLRDGAKVSGAFRITTAPTAGTVTGSWHVTRRDQDIHLKAFPEGGWIPGEAPPMARLMYRLVSMFQTWPTTYAWSGTLLLPPPHQHVDGPLPFTSAWERMK